MNDLSQHPSLVKDEAARTDLDGARVEIEAIKETLSLTQGQLAERDAKMGELQRTLSLTQGQLAEKGALADANEQELTTLKAEVASLSEAIAEKDRLLTNATETMTEAIARYKALAVAANPPVPEEMITGQSIADIDASLETAKGLVTRVRATLEEEAKATTVPPGAPARTGPPDLSGLSPREKIQYAIQKEEK